MGRSRAQPAEFGRRATEFANINLTMLVHRRRIISSSGFDYYISVRASVSFFSLQRRPHHRRVSLLTHRPLCYLLSRSITYANEKFGVISKPPATLCSSGVELWQLPVRAWCESACFRHKKLGAWPSVLSGKLVRAGESVQPWEPGRRLCALRRDTSVQYAAFLFCILRGAESGSIRFRLLWCGRRSHLF